MSDPTYERVVLPSRKAIMATYSGPKGELGRGIQPLAAWVGTYYKDRVGDVTVIFAERPSGAEPPTTPIAARIVFEVDDDFKESTLLPEGLVLRLLPSETLLYTTYNGPLTGFGPVLVGWLSAMAESHTLGPGFRQRMVKTAKSPADKGWEVEMSVVLAS